MFWQLDDTHVNIYQHGENGPCFYLGESDREAGSADDFATRLAKEAGYMVYTLVVYEVTDWNSQLSPWPAKAAFGEEMFAGRGADTLAWLADKCIPRLREDGLITKGVPQYTAGYSLSGLFALWAFLESDLFDGAVSCSGSLWIDGWKQLWDLDNRLRDALKKENIPFDEKPFRAHITLARKARIDTEALKNWPVQECAFRVDEITLFQSTRINGVLTYLPLEKVGFKISGKAVIDGGDDMTHEEYNAAANHWIKKNAISKKMPADQLWEAIENYIQANNTCALATGSGSFIRCTPIEYAWHDGAFWMFSEGGQKFVGLEENKSVCLAIYDRYDGFGRLKGMQVSGTAEIMEPFSAEYIQAAEWKKISVDALRKLSFTMNLIKITPTEIEFLNSDFKEDGYDSRQHYDCGGHGRSRGLPQVICGKE